MLLNLILLLNVFIMGYVILSLGCYTWYAVTIASLAVGDMYNIYLSCCHLYLFTSYNCPYALKIKYSVTRGYQFLLDSFCTSHSVKGLAYLQYHCYTSIA